MAARPLCAHNLAAWVGAAQCSAVQHSKARCGTVPRSGLAGLVDGHRKVVSMLSRVLLSMLRWMHISAASMQQVTVSPGALLLTVHLSHLLFNSHGALGCEQAAAQHDASKHCCGRHSSAGSYCGWHGRHRRRVWNQAQAAAANRAGPGSCGAAAAWHQLLPPTAS